MSRHQETIAALATPAGTSAVALVRISGPDTSALVAALAGAPLPPRHVRHLDYLSTKGELLDDVLVTWFRAPASYTGEDAAEISCHGNPFIAQKILEDLFARGCRAAQPGEFTQRAFLNGRLDLSQAEAVMDVIHAQSERALAAAQRQMRGALSRRMESLVDRLLTVLARAEAYIDFPEEDLPPEDEQLIDSELQWISTEAQQLLATSQYGEWLRSGVKTLVVGAPNVGKSSLVNRLVGYERVLVSPEPGTTRDFVEESIALGGHRLRLIDTAGLNPSPAPLEKLGINKTLERVAEADIFLVVLDQARSAPEPLSPSVLARLTPENTLVVLNKSDLPAAGPLPAWAAGLRHVPVSALTGDGFGFLVSEIEKLLAIISREIGDDLVAVSARHAHALGDARTALACARQKLRDHEAAELLASDLRMALAAFGEITGKVDNEQMLDRLFASFCIGK